MTYGGGGMGLEAIHSAANQSSFSHPTHSHVPGTRKSLRIDLQAPPLEQRRNLPHDAHCTSHRARTVHSMSGVVFQVFQEFSGWQGRGDLTGKHTTTEACTPPPPQCTGCCSCPHPLPREVDDERRKMHSLAWPSHQRGMYLTGCPSPQGSVSSVLHFELLPCGVPSPARQLFRPFRMSLHYLMECPLPG